MLSKAVYEMDGPVAIRYPRGGEGEYKDCSEAESAVIREGNDITVVAYGTMINTALELCEKLDEENTSAELIKIGQIKPLDCSAALKSISKTGKLIIAEDVCENSCIGNQILAQAGVEGITIKGASLCNLGGGLVSHGTVDELMHDCGLDTESLFKKAVSLVRGVQ